VHQGWHEAGGLLGSRRGEGFLSCGFLNIIPAARSILVFLPLAARFFTPKPHEDMRRAGLAEPAPRRTTQAREGRRRVRESGGEETALARVERNHHDKGVGSLY
jgi:hypothetical protein